MRKSDLHITFKNIFNIALITLIFVGCTNVPEKYINLENESTKLSQNSSTYEMVWDKFFKGDMDIINSDYFTEDVKVVLPGDDLVGIEALKNYYGNYVNGFSDAEFTFVDLFGEGDKLVSIGILRGLMMVISLAYLQRAAKLISQELLLS